MTSIISVYFLNSSISSRCWVLGTSECVRYVDSNWSWPDLHCLVLSEAQRQQGDRVVSEICCYISSLPAAARALLQAVRSHWGVEKCPALGPGHGLPGGRESHPHGPCQGASRPAGTTRICSRSCHIRNASALGGTMMQLDTVGQRINYIRQEMGLTLEALAARSWSVEELYLGG